MSKYYYKKTKTIKVRYVVRILSLFVSLVGLCVILYVFSPFLLWQIYFAPVFASQNFTAPIPKNTIVDKTSLKNLLTSSTDTLKGVDYTNATNWFPSFKSKQITFPVASYSISIPKLSIQNAVVSTSDYDLTLHLVQYSGTALPPENGNAVIFGHSTLPQLFNPNDYKTIFANAYKMQDGDVILVSRERVSYAYKVFSIIVVDPDDTSVLSQAYDNSYLTLITCTPPGTIWKRLVIKARLQNL